MATRKRAIRNAWKRADGDGSLGSDRDSGQTSGEPVGATLIRGSFPAQSMTWQFFAG
jgi:hypothetical protein